MAEPIKDGDLVRLKSGGPTMTAMHVGPLWATCVWFTPDQNGSVECGAFNQVDFSISALEHVK
jgi:uncharacterized protein YodC (DUF2158 family)